MAINNITLCGTIFFPYRECNNNHSFCHLSCKVYILYIYASLETRVDKGWEGNSRYRSVRLFHWTGILEWPKLLQKCFPESRLLLSCFANLLVADSGSSWGVLPQSLKGQRSRAYLISLNKGGYG